MNIALIGSGNVATHLARALVKAGHGICQVYSPTWQHAQQLANQVNAQAIAQLNQINPTLDIYIIAVKDSAIAGVVAQLAQLKLQGSVVHTSGSGSIELLHPLGCRVGVLYPLQTFSKLRAMELAGVPLLLETSNAHTRLQLDHLARSVSAQVYYYDTAQRRSLHLAAVLACNFSNFLYTLAHQYVAQQNVEFALLKPLILETAQKIQDHAPHLMQTGPAVRHDQAIMNLHLAMLADQPQLQQLYQQLSEGIMQLHQPA